MDFSQFSENELEAIIDGRSTPDLLKKLTLDDEEQLVAVRDEALKDLLCRRIEASGSLYTDVFETILSTTPTSAARSLIGECAQRDLLSDCQIEVAYTELDPLEWSHRQVLGRRLLRALPISLKTDDRLAILQQLLENSLAWALLEALPVLSRDEMRRLSARIDSSKELVRRERNRLKIAVEGQLKRIVD